MLQRSSCSRSSLPVDAPEIVVGGTGTLGGDHAGADGRCGRAGGAKDTALPGLDFAGQHGSAFAGCGVGHAVAGDGEALLGVPLRVFFRNGQAGFGNPSKSAPFEGLAHFKDTRHEFQSHSIALF